MSNIKCDKIDERVIEDGVPVYILRFKGKQYYRMINPEYIKHIFLKEDCEVLNPEEYENSKSLIRYKYIGNDERCKMKDKIYTVRYNEWKNDKIRKHFGDFGNKTSFFKSSIYETVRMNRLMYES